ncbi:MAG: helix-turn-helix domain-containing protein [Luteitalea sp.]|nr:helix-turn-helix domain-containing protein [Luteitalea sp.]
MMSTLKGIYNPKEGRREAQLYRRIGEKIREVRMRRQVSQIRLAELTGTTPNTISRWETGTYKPSVAHLERLARSLGAPITIFISQTEPDATSQTLLSAIADLDDDDREDVLHYIEFRRSLKRMRKRSPGGGSSSSRLRDR